jgi:hypothetical protein
MGHRTEATTRAKFRNQIVSYVGTVTDITERKQAEDVIFKEKPFRNYNK